MTGPYQSQWGYSEQARRIREERVRLLFEDSPDGEKAFCEQSGFSWRRLRALETESDLHLLTKKLTVHELQLFAGAGIDVQFILTGVRSITLNREEQALLDNYRASSEQNQDHLEAVGNAFAQSALAIEERMVVGGGSATIARDRALVPEPAQPRGRKTESRTNDATLAREEQKPHQDQIWIEKQFLKLVEKLIKRDEELDHAKGTPLKLAVNIKEVKIAARAHRLELPATGRTLTNALRACGWKGNHGIRSAFALNHEGKKGKTVKCWEKAI